MKQFTAVVEKCSDNGLYVGYVPGFPGAHSQAEILDELQQNLKEVIEMLIEDGEPNLNGQPRHTRHMENATPRLVTMDRMLQPRKSPSYW
jgi:predicted RNase H-like HicB family nuclease